MLPRSLPHLAPHGLGIASGLPVARLGHGPRAAPPGTADELGAAALILGTAIGGGFLALPYTVAPAGCTPPTVVWFWT